MPMMNYLIHVHTVYVATYWRRLLFCDLLLTPWFPWLLRGFTRLRNSPDYVYPAFVYAWYVIPSDHVFAMVKW
jgi:hypothetical protein